MIICFNARNQESVLSGSREKCTTGGCIQGWLGLIYIKLQKQLYEIKIAAFFFILQDLYLNSSGIAKRAKRQKKSRGIGEFGDVGYLYLMMFGDFPKTIT